MFRRSATEDLIKEILGQNYVQLTAKSYGLEEHVADGECSVSVKIERTETVGREEMITGRGVGFVDALYRGLIEHYATEYPSLSTISFTNFEVKGEMATSMTQGADAECVVNLVVQNSEKLEFRFEEKGHSLVAAAMHVVVEAAEYFINSERAYIVVYKARTDARQRNRQDLVQRYTAQLAELVRTTSYSDVIERIKDE